MPTNAPATASWRRKNRFCESQSVHDLKHISPDPLLDQGTQSFKVVVVEPWVTGILFDNGGDLDQMI